MAFTAQLEPEQRAQTATLNPYVQAFTRTQEFEQLPPEKRQDYLLEFARLRPDEQQNELGGMTHRNPRWAEEIADTLHGQLGMTTYPQTPTPAEFGKRAAAMAISMVGQAGAPLLAPATRPLAQGVLGALGGYGTRRVNQLLGLEEGKPTILPQANFGDIAVTAPPLVHGLAGAAVRFGTRPAQQAVLGADVATLTRTEAAAQKYADWQQKGAVIDREFQQDLVNIRERTALSNMERERLYQEKLAAWRDRRAAHNQAALEVPAEGMRGITLDDYNAAYARGEQAAQHARPVDPQAFRDLAASLNVQLEMPAPGVQYPFRRITAALEGWGVQPAQGQANAYNAAFGPTGGPTGATPGPVSLPQVLATQKALGRVISQTVDRGGIEYGAARKLFAGISDMIDALADPNSPAFDPSAVRAIRESARARRAFMRAESAQDWHDIFARNTRVIETGPHGPTQVELNFKGIQTDLENTILNDRFYTQAWTPAELINQRVAVSHLPTEAIGAEPSPARLLPGKYGERTNAYLKAVQRHAEAEPSTVVEPVKPDVGSIPMGKGIMGKILGGMVGGIVGERTGVGTYPGIVAGATTGAGVILGPYIVSALILNGGAKGEAVVRNILAGNRTLNASQVGALVTAARRLKVPLDQPSDEHP